MIKPFDPTKPVQTRDGRSSRVICTDRKGNASLIALIVEGRDGNEIARSYYANGRLDKFTQHPMDLVNIPETVEINHWQLFEGRAPTGFMYKDEEAARYAAKHVLFSSHPISVMHIQGKAEVI